MCTTLAKKVFSLHLLYIPIAYTLVQAGSCGNILAFYRPISI